MVAAFLSSPAVMAVALAIFCVVLFLVSRQSRLFRQYGSLKEDLCGIAERLEHGAIARDKVDILVTGELERVPFSIRFSHLDTAPGMYIRCATPVDFSLSFEAYTNEAADSPDVCRTGDSVFDRRFVGRTNNRFLAKQLFSQVGIQEHLQQLCCSNKTMLRMADDAIELSEALIPGDTQEHVISHLESLIVLSGMLPGKRTGAKARVQGARRIPWPVRIAAAVVLVGVGIFLVKTLTETVDATSQASSALSEPFSRAVPNSSGWMQADTKDLDPSFVEWMQKSGVNPETKITLEAGTGNVVYFLRAETGEKVKRVVWMHNSKVVFDLVGPVDGVIRIPKDSLSSISWAEGAAPGFVPDGDGLLVVRDHTKPGSATVYFTSDEVLHTAIPSDYAQISLM